MNSNKAFEKYIELTEQGVTSKVALRVINEKLEEEGIEQWKTNTG